MYIVRRPLNKKNVLCLGGDRILRDLSIEALLYPLPSRWTIPLIPRYSKPKRCHGGILLLVKIRPIGLVPYLYQPICRPPLSANRKNCHLDQSFSSLGLSCSIIAASSSVARWLPMGGSAKSSPSLVEAGQLGLQLVVSTAGSWPSRKWATIS